MLVESRFKIVALTEVVENDSAEGVKASDVTLDTSRSLCFSVDNIGVNVGSMTGRIVVFKSMCWAPADADIVSVDSDVLAAVALLTV